MYHNSLKADDITEKLMILLKGIDNNLNMRSETKDPAMLTN